MGRRHCQGFRRTFRARNAAARDIPFPRGGRARPQAPARLDATRAPGDQPVVPSRAIQRGRATAGRGRHRGALELSAVPRRRAARSRARGRQPGHGEDVGDHAGHRRTPRASRGAVLSRGRGFHRQRRPGSGARVLPAAFRPPAVHGLDRRRAPGDACRRRQPDASDAGTGREIPRHRRSRLSRGGGSQPGDVRQVPQCRTDLHRPRLRARPGGIGGRLHRGGAAHGRRPLPHAGRQPRLHGHRRRSAPRAPRATSRRGPRQGGNPVRDQPRGRESRRNRQARPHAPHRRRRLDGRDARGDFRSHPAGGALSHARRGHRLRECAAAAARAVRVRDTRARRSSRSCGRRFPGA